MSFGLPPTISKKEIKTHKKLSQACCEVDLLTDDLFVMDANSVADDARYFVFGVIPCTTNFYYCHNYNYLLRTYIITYYLLYIITSIIIQRV
jgi:hypothetical protein